MAQFASDSFTGTSGTELATYSANWIKPTYSGSANWLISDANRARGGGANTTYYHTGTPASADYTVKVDLYFVAGSGSYVPGVCGRLDTSAQTYYHARGTRTSNTTLNWELYKRVAGTFTQLGSGSAQTVAVGGTYELKLSMVGTTIELYDEGGGSPTISATDSAITAAGYSGIRDNITSSNTAGYHFDNFSADDVVGGSATDLTIQDATHGHTADSLTITVSSTLAIQDAAHAQTADSLAITLGYVDLVIADATHAHTADNLTLSVSGATNLTIQDATHGHSADSPTLTLGYVDLLVADALHGHFADNLTLTGNGLAAETPTRRHAGGYKLRKGYLIKGRRYFLSEDELAVHVAHMLQEVSRGDVKEITAGKPKVINRRTWDAIKPMERLTALMPATELIAEDDDEETLLMLM